MIAVVASPDGSSLCRAQLAGEAQEGEQLGARLADELRRQGADKILARVDS
jgi:hydroxymethylbilane synthase